MDESKRRVLVRFPGHKGKAYHQYKTALRKGDLVRATECSDCKATGVQIYGHHTDYHEPLKVDWLCGSCHRFRHNIPIPPITELRSFERISSPQERPFYCNHAVLEFFGGHPHPWLLIQQCKWGNRLFGFYARTRDDAVEAAR